MKKVVRRGKIADQDKFRREDVQNMTPDERVKMLLKMQYNYFKWDQNPKIQRIATVKRSTVQI